MAPAEGVESSDGVVFVPAMVGLGAPHWDPEARGAILGLSRHHNSAHLARAALESIAFQIADVFFAMEAATGLRFKELRADGGATRNTSLMQFQADVLGQPVLRSLNEELSAIGAAWLSGLSLGWWESANELELLASEPDRFVPNPDSEKRELLYKGWTQAVKQARQFGSVLPHDSHGERSHPQARGVVRRYPGTLALDQVNYYVHRGQVNVLIGENGAGKSTLMRILAGVESQDEGDLLLEGAPVRFESPRDAARHGISIVHQELSILPNLDLAENIFAGREPVKMHVLLDRSTEEERSLEALRRLRSPLDISTHAGHLSLGSRQMVEVARTLDQGAKILILDEPTSALSNVEAEALFRVIADLKRSGVTIIYISHRLHELLHIGDQFTVLRSGRVVGAALRSEVSREWIVERMSGRDVATDPVPDRCKSSSDVVLSLEGLSLPASCGEDDFQAPITDVGFELRRGEDSRDLRLVRRRPHGTSGVPCGKAADCCREDSGERHSRSGCHP